MNGGHSLFLSYLIPKLSHFMKSLVVFEMIASLISHDKCSQVEILIYFYGCHGILWSYLIYVVLYSSIRLTVSDLSLEDNGSIHLHKTDKVNIFSSISEKSCALQMYVPAIRFLTFFKKSSTLAFLLLPSKNGGAPVICQYVVAVKLPPRALHQHEKFFPSVMFTCSGQSISAVGFPEIL